MPRTYRIAVGGVCYHILNRGNGRMGIFRKPQDYKAFIDLLLEGKERANVDLFGYCVMPNHWHLALRPAGDEDLAKYLSWVTNTHVKRYRSHYRHTSGHLYQGRYKSFPIEEDGHLLTVLRYTEGNAVRAKLVRRARDWEWGSLALRRAGGEFAERLLAPWPVDRPADWEAIVNENLKKPELAEVRLSVVRGRPFGTETWIKATAARLGLGYTLQPRGRPRKRENVVTQ